MYTFKVQGDNAIKLLKICRDKYVFVQRIDVNIIIEDHLLHYMDVPVTKFLKRIYVTMHYRSTCYEDMLC